MKISFDNEVEQLEYEISVLKKASREPAYAQYLCSVESRLIGNPNDASALRHEMIKNYNTYSGRMAAAGIAVAPNYHEAIYPGMEAPKVINSQKDNANIAQAMQAQAFDSVANVSFDDATSTKTPVQNAPIQPAVMPGAPVAPAPVQSVFAPAEPVQSAPVQTTSAQNVSAANVSAQPMPAQPIPAQPMPVQSKPMQNEPMQQRNASVSSNSYSDAEMSQSNQQAQNNMVGKNRAEFAIGGIVLSVLGTVLILTGAIMLAVNFFDANWQGISLYAVCVLLFLFSELFIRKFVDKLSSVLTSLSIGGAFVVTLVNYFALHIYNMPTTLALLIVLSMAVGVYSYFRNNFLFSLIGYFASFTSLSLISQASGNAEIYMIYGIMLVSGLLWTAVPIKKHGRAFGIIQLFTSIFLVFWFTPTISGFFDNYSSSSDWFRCLILTSLSYVALSVMVLLNGMRYFKDSDEGFDDSFSISLNFYRIMFIIANVIYSIMYLVCYAAIGDEYGAWGMVISGCAVIIPNAIIAYVLYLKESSLWIACACAAAFTGATCLGWNEGKWGGVIVCFVLMSILSVLAYIKKSVGFNIADLLFKIYLFIIMFVQIASCNEEPYVMRYICIVGILLAIVLATGYKLPIQIIMTGLLAIDICTLVPEKTIPVVITLILAITVGLFHNIKWFKSDNMYAFDIPVWITLIAVTFTLYIPMFRDELSTVVLTLVFGLCIVIQYYFERYETFLAGKMLPIGIFITLYIPIFRMENIMVSIILMSLALVCVALGFIFRQKGIRIYGLVLAILVCAKIGFYDFWSADSLIKTVMFFVVGILSLVIAGVYIVVEKKLSKQDNVD